MTIDSDTNRFGDPADFAIDVGVEPDLTPPSAVWGHMRVWCAGVPLGNFNDRYCALHPAYAGFRWLSANVGELWDDALAGLGDRELWGLLRGSLYGFHGNGISVPGPVVSPDDPQVGAAWARFERFGFLTNWGEQFDGYPAFIICPPGAAESAAGTCRIVFRAGVAGEPTGVTVSRAAVVSVSEAFVEWFEGQEQRVMSETE